MASSGGSSSGAASRRLVALSGSSLDRSSSQQQQPATAANQSAAQNRRSSAINFGPDAYQQQIIIATQEQQQQLQQRRRNSSASECKQQQQQECSQQNQPAQCSANEDIDIVFNRLMSLDAFRKLHPSVIRNLCSYAFIERVDKGVIVFRQGDDAINWYALLEGSVDVRVSQSGNQKDGVTLCTLGVGTTFGASVMPGKSHSVSVVTSDDCTLLRVRRADFQEIFNEQSHLINNVESSPFCSFTSLNRTTPHHQQARNVSSSSSSSVQQQQQQQRRSSISQQKQQQTAPIQIQSATASSSINDNNNNNKATSKGENCDTNKEELNAELNLDCIDSSELSSHLMRIGWVLRTLMLADQVQMIQDRRVPLPPQTPPAPAPAPAPLANQSQQQLKAKPPLVSMGSSSHLLQGSTASSLVIGPRSAGRKVANYVASSFMRNSSSSGGGSNSTKQQQQQQQIRQQQQSSYSSTSFDSNGIISGSSSSGGSNVNNQSVNLMAAAAALESQPLFKRSMVGREMVDWLLQLSQSNATANAARFVSSRLQAVSMWQVLLEQGIIYSHHSAASSDASNSPPDASSSSSSSELLATGGANKQSVFQFCDEQVVLYKFWFDRESPSAAAAGVGDADLGLAHESLWWSLKVLSKLAPDALFRMILCKRPHERTNEEVDIVFEELQHLKALSHLTNSVKKELAACVRSEHHSKQNTVIFNQGDVGHSWYIILRGSVNVVIVGKGVVCSLHEGDDFGKLALVNDAPRAATIVTSEANCYFLRVDKHNFNTILRDVEANTVRLKEHGKEVLILQKVAAKEQATTANLASDSSDPLVASATTTATSANLQQQQQPEDQPANSTTAIGSSTSPAGVATQASASSAGDELQQQQQQQQQTVSGGSAVVGQQQQSSVSSALKYMVMAGTAEKMLEHLLETRIDGQSQIGPLLGGKSSQLIKQHDQVSTFLALSSQGDNFLEDFILTHKIFMPTRNLCNELLKQYQCQTKCQLSQQQSSSSAGPQLRRRSSLIQQLHDAASLDDQYLVAKKRRVIKFIRCWMLITREHFFQQHQIQSFLSTIHEKVREDATTKFASLQPELKAIGQILELHLEEELALRHMGVQRWIDDIYGNILPIRRHSGQWDSSRQQQADQYLRALHARRFEHKLSVIQPDDEIVFRVYCADHSFATLRTRIDAKAAEIKQLAARKLNLIEDNNNSNNNKQDQLILVHVKSNGERIIYNDLEFNISTSLSVNGRIFVCPLDHIDAISPLPEQDPFQEVYQGLAANSQVAAPPGGAADNQQTQPSSSNNISEQPDQVAPGSTNGQAAISSHLLSSTPVNYSDIKLQMSLSVSKLEEFSSRDIAHCLTQIAWNLLKNMHEFELIYTVFGRHNFKQITANMNVFLRHFNEIQYWVVTQICLSSSLSKRVQILRKFIKIAAHCKELQNLNAFFAIIMGLSNMAVARLTQTWERLPSKLKRTFSQFESLIDPSRNHRRYRIFISKMEPPIIPFMPLFLKDMTFAHEGNKTYLENGLINFEKMQMVAQTLRTIRYCKSRPMKLDASACKFKGSVRSIELFFRDLKIIDNQRTLTQMSHQLEHRKT